MEERSFQAFDKLRTFQNLPSLPQILLKLIELCWNEDSSIKDMARIIHTDASLSTKVMSMASSCAYGPMNGAANIEKALEVLGKNAVKNIVISASDIQAFSKGKDYSVFGLKGFWRHSLMCAVLSKLIAEQIVYPFPEEAFLAGLLHDVGKLVLWASFPEKYADILKLSKYRRELILQQEARHGATHCEVGAWLIKRWNLQSFMADAVLYHHEPLARIQHALPLIKILYVGDALCPELNKQNVDKFKIAEKVLGLEISTVDNIIRQAQETVQKTALSLGLEIEPLEGSGTVLSEIDYQKQEKLIDNVKDISLLQGTLQNLLEARDQDSILKVLQQGLDALFDVKQILFFLYDSERNILLGKRVSPNKQFDYLNAVTIPFEEGKSLLVKALLQGSPLDSFRDLSEDNHTIIDEQIIRLLEKDGILCLPMIAGKQYIGVIVLGVKEIRFSDFIEKIKLLMMFAKQAATALYATNTAQSLTKSVQQDRPFSPSTLARKVAHEINTPLSIIKNYLSVLSRKLPENESFQEELTIINEEINCVALTIRELSDSSGHKNRANDPLDINALLANLVKILQQSLLLEPNIKAHLELDPSLPKVLADKNRIKQVFSNLIINAAEAMPGGGNLNIRTRHVFDYIDTQTEPSADSTMGHAEITITDDGPGIVDTVKSGLFDPYVSSKGTGHAGLGLAIVYNNIKDLKGTITCENNNKEGAGFKIVIPITHNCFS